MPAPRLAGTTPWDPRALQPRRGRELAAQARQDGGQARHETRLPQALESSVTSLPGLQSRGLRDGRARIEMSANGRSQISPTRSTEVHSIAQEIGAELGLPEAPRTRRAPSNFVVEAVREEQTSLLVRETARSVAVCVDDAVAVDLNRIFRRDPLPTPLALRSSHCRAPFKERCTTRMMTFA